MSGDVFTLERPASHQEEIRKSRFLANAAPVGDAVQALEFVQRVGDLTANHNCWAYRIGQEYRFNDDGEPGGTAGRPILQAIEGQSCDRVVVVLTRWFGGIKLGAGGLVRAYGGTAAECLRRADRVPLVVMARLALHCDFAELALFKARLREMDASIDSETFDANGAQLIISLPADRAAEAQLRVSDLSHGRVMARVID
jgi:uncharacterized YigZ family protein